MTDHIDAIETTDQPTRSDECPHQRQLTDQSLQLADQIQATDPERANAIKEIGPKVAVVIANAGDGYNLKEIGKLKVMEKFFTDAKITTKQLKNRNTMLSYPATRENTGKQIIQVIDEIYKEYKGLKEDQEENKKLWEQLEQAKKSQSEALTAHPDLASQVASAETLDASLTTPDQQIAFATEQLHYEKSEAEKIVKNYQNSQYAEAGLSIGQLLSFLQTEQALGNNGIDSDPFLADVAKIRDDLQISAPKTKKTEPDI